MALGFELFVDLGAKTMHQDNLDTHALDHGQVLRNMVQLARSDGLAAQPDHESLVAELVDVGCHRAEPGHKGEVEDRGHVGAQAVRA